MTISFIFGGWCHGMIHLVFSISQVTHLNSWCHIWLFFDKRLGNKIIILIYLFSWYLLVPSSLLSFISEQSPFPSTVISKSASKILMDFTGANEEKEIFSSLLLISCNMVSDKHSSKAWSFFPSSLWVVVAFLMIHLDQKDNLCCYHHVENLHKQNNLYILNNFIPHYQPSFQFFFRIFDFDCMMIWFKFSWPSCIVTELWFRNGFWLG